MVLCSEFFDLKIYEDWINKAFASLLNAYLQSKINSKELNKNKLEDIPKCFSKNELTLPIMTKCVLKILQNKKFETKRFLKFKNRKNGEFNNNENIKTTKILQQKIEIKKQPNYILSDAKRIQGLSPVGGLARFLMTDMLKRTNRTEIKATDITIRYPLN
uniref:Uncharacterized protein n=1 Tax=Meloidogyne incognita TaxID=6306 RepID=A0A914MVD1_MELIC